MFRQTLFTQWKWARLELVFYVLTAFGVPAILINVRPYFGYDSSVTGWMEVSKLGALFFISLAFVCGASLAAGPWVKDNSGRHIYAMSLPVAWPTFVRLRFLAGATLLAVPAVALFLGSLVAAASANLPATLHAYPAGITLRWYLSALLFYGLAFALQYLAGRSAAKVAVIIMFAVGAVEIAAQLVGFHSPTAALWMLLTSWPGPLDTLTARWMLIDV